MARGRKKLSINVKIARLEAQLKELREQQACASIIVLPKGVQDIGAVEPIEPETEVEPV